MRDDIDTSDVPLINFMLNTIVDFSRDIEPDLYKRYLAIVLDGLRPRNDLEPLPVERAEGRRTFQDAMATGSPEAASQGRISWIVQALPSGSLKKTCRNPGRPSAPSVTMSPSSMPRPVSSS